MSQNNPSSPGVVPVPSSPEPSPPTPGPSPAEVPTSPPEVEPSVRPGDDIPGRWEPQMERGSFYDE